MRQFELVIPCWNESGSLVPLIQAGREAALEYSFEADRFQLVLVDNGSTDDSARILQELSEGPLGKWFRVVSLKENQGYGGGIFAGLSTTTADFVGWAHADLQCDLKDAFLALEELKNGATSNTLIKGRRHGRSPQEFLVSRGFELAVGWYLDFWCYEINAQPKVFPRKLLREISQPSTGILFDSDVLRQASAAGYRINSIPIKQLARISGHSSWGSTLPQKLKTYQLILSQLQRARLIGTKREQSPS